MSGTVLVAVTVTALLLAGCAAQTGPEPVATSRVDLPPSYGFEPEAIEVSAGTTITWTNSDNFTHTVRTTDDGRVLGTLEPGQSLEHTFEQAGSYRYDCSLHPNDMDGTVIVTEPGAP